MNKEKMNLRDASNLSYDDLVAFMKANYELYNYALDDLINMNIEWEICGLNRMDGIEINSMWFGSVYANDYDANITDINEFLVNDFSNDNETFYDLLEELKHDKDNNNLVTQVLNLMFGEIDERATMEGYDIDEILQDESDFFDNWLDDLYVDLNTMKAYRAYELEDMDIDLNEID